MRRFAPTAIGYVGRASTSMSHAADENGLDEDVPEHYEEMTERGAHQRGEGRIA